MTATDGRTPSQTRKKTNHALDSPIGDTPYSPPPPPPPPPRGASGPAEVGRRLSLGRAARRDAKQGLTGSGHPAASSYPPMPGMDHAQKKKQSEKTIVGRSKATETSSMPPAMTRRRGRSSADSDSVDGPLPRSISAKPTAADVACRGVRGGNSDRETMAVLAETPFSEPSVDFEKSRRDESILRDLSLVLTGGREEDDPEPNICAGARSSDERAKPMRKVSKEGAGGVSTSHLDIGSVSMYSNSANDEEYQYGEPTLGSNGSSESNIIAISTESSDFSYGGEKMVFSQKKKGRNGSRGPHSKPTVWTWTRVFFVLLIPLIFLGGGGFLFWRIFAPGGVLRQGSENSEPEQPPPLVQDTLEDMYDVYINNYDTETWAPTVELPPAPKPTLYPTRSPTEPKPTLHPTSQPTGFSGHQSFSFYVIGDIPYTEEEVDVIEHQIQNMVVDPTQYLDNQGAQFVVHVGDIMKGGNSARCYKWQYQMVEQMYTSSCPVPAFVLPGDNDWHDCPDPAEGFAHWKDSFSTMEMAWDGTQSPIPQMVRRMPARSENFAFTHGGVLFVGINLISEDPNNNKKDLNARMEHNRQWIREQVGRHSFDANPPPGDATSVRAVIFFGHHRSHTFYRNLRDELMPLNVPMVHFHGNGHRFELEKLAEDIGWDNFWVSQVDMGGIAPPIRVTIQGTTETAKMYPLEARSIHHQKLGSTIHLDRRGGTLKGPMSTSSWEL